MAALNRFKWPPLTKLQTPLIAAIELIYKKFLQAFHYKHYAVPASTEFLYLDSFLVSQFWRADKRRQLKCVSVLKREGMTLKVPYKFS